MSTLKKIISYIKVKLINLGSKINKKVHLIEAELIRLFITRENVSEYDYFVFFWRLFVFCWGLLLFYLFLVGAVEYFNSYSWTRVMEKMHDTFCLPCSLKKLKAFIKKIFKK